MPKYEIFKEFSDEMFELESSLDLIIQALE